MVREERSIVINAPVEEVFAFVADEENAPRWQHGLLEVRRITPGAPGLGTKDIFVRKFMGRRLEATNEYVEFYPNRKIVFKIASGPMPGAGTYLTEPAPRGTKLTSIVEMHPGRFIALAERKIAASLGREMEAGLAVLKEMLESETVRARA